MAISLAAMKVWACLLAGLIAGSTTPCAVAGDEHDRGTYNNKMALLGFLLESAQQRAGRDVQTLPVDEHQQRRHRAVRGNQP